MGGSKPVVEEKWVGDNLEVHIVQGDDTFIWYDNAHVDYPEDLCWSRMISDVFWAGFRMGKNSANERLRGAGDEDKK